MTRSINEVLNDVVLEDVDPIRDSLMAVDVMIVARLQDRETGLTELYVTKSEGTDPIVQNGLALSLEQVIAEEPWKPRPE